MNEQPKRKWSGAPVERPRPKYMDAPTRRALAGIREQRVADKIGGRTVPGSGCSIFAKGDVKDTRFGALLIEQKGTGNKSLGVEYAWLKKITAEAMAVGRVPALVMSFDLAEGDREVPPDWCALPLNYVRELMERVAGNG